MLFSIKTLGDKILQIPRNTESRHPQTSNERKKKKCVP